MKKEWLAIALLVLVIVGSCLNLRILKAFIRDLDTQIAESVSEADSGNWPAAESSAIAAMQNWTAMDKYTHIFIRHSSIDEVTDSFCAFLGAIRAKDPAQLLSDQLALRNRLSELYEMERVTPGSIL